MAVQCAWCSQAGPKLKFWPTAARALEEDGSPKWHHQSMGCVPHRAMVGKILHGEDEILSIL
jgi:hypothetical protein